MNKPIIFNAEMVQAVLSGKKTQTRRVIKPQPFFCNGAFQWETPQYTNNTASHCYSGDNERFERFLLNYCPYGKPGDELWVRETFCIGKITGGDAIEGGSENLFVDQTFTDKDLIYKEHCISNNIDIDHLIWKPSIFMPRWASRIQLLIKDIRVERVCDISEEDALSEGAMHRHAVGHYGFEHDPDNIYRRNFAVLWDSINSKRGFGWNKNPWVWVVEFERITKL